MTPSFVRTLLTGTIAGAAFLTLFLRTDWRRYGLLMGVAFSLSLGLLRLPFPELWTPEVALGRECLLALLGAFLGMQLVRHGSLTLVTMLMIGAMGWVTCRMPTGEHWAYRGLAFVDLAVAALLWATWVEMDHHGTPLQRLAVTRLRYTLALQTIYCCSWEYGAEAAGFMATIVCLANCWFMFGVTRMAFNGHAGSPGEPLQVP